MAFSCFTDLIKYLIGFNQNSSFPINDLPLEILLEILYGLPVKQLHRNKIVCKLWSSLISNPSFPSEFSFRAILPTFTLSLAIHRLCNCIHTKHFTNDGKSWFEEKEDPFKFLPGGERGGINKVQCLGSSNGLVLVNRTDYSCSCSCFYYVCNPTTKQWITLPSPPSCTSLVISGFVCNLNSENPNSETQFKVVRFMNPIYSLEFIVEIFDSATNLWKVSKMQINVRISFRQVDVNVIEHRGILYRECRKSNSVLIFDPNADQCYMFPLPGSSNDHVHHKLDVSQNDLYYVEMDFRPEHINLSTIWRYDELEGKPTWVVHRNFALYDWALEQSIWGFKLRNDHIDLRTYLEHGQVLGIDPANCNILYVYFWHICRIKIYSIDIERKMIENTSSIYHYIGWRTKIFRDVGKLNEHETQMFTRLQVVINQ